MFGVYDVEAQDGTSYRAAYVSEWTGALRDDAGVAVRFTLATANGRGEATARDGRKGSVALSSPDADRVVVDGNVATQKLSLRLKRRTTLPLFLSRGFHFVNEFPFNR